MRARQVIFVMEDVDAASDVVQRRAGAEASAGGGGKGRHFSYISPKLVVFW